MRKRIFFLAFVFTVFLVFAAIPYKYIEFNAAIDTSEKAEKALEDKIAKLQQEQKDLKNKIASTKDNIESYQEKKSYLDALVKSTQNEIDTANALIEEKSKNIEQKNTEIADLESAIENKYKLMQERLRFTYEEGTASYLELILDAENLSDFLMTVERVGSMLDFDRTLMSDLNSSLQTLENTRNDLMNSKKSQEELKQKLIKKKSDLEKQINDSVNYISKLQTDQATLEAEYKKSKAAEDEANERIAALLAERQRQTNAKYIGGEFLWPLPLNNNNISSPYGWRFIFGHNEFHRGIDITAPYGTSVFAANSGTVVTSAYHYSYGYYVIIDHGGGIATLYAHNSQLLVSEGAKVTKGQVIAKVGSTGNSTGNHTHFEVRVNGNTVNPLDGYVVKP